MLGTLSKAQKILDLYEPERPEWGVSEVARELKLPPSRTHLLMASLADMGILHRTAAGRYRLGFRLLKLTQILLLNTPWREEVSAELTRLAAQSGETTYAAALDGGHLTTLDARLGARSGAIPPARITKEPPLHASASGKVLLAFRSQTDDTLLPRLLPALADQATFTAALAETRRTGVAFNEEEVEAGLCAVAAPVRNHNGEVIAAISLLAPPARFQARRAELVQATRDAAQAVSAAIGYLPGGLADEDRLQWASVRGEVRLKSRPRQRR